MTLTWGDQAENNHGMEIFGTPADEGLNEDDMKGICKYLDELGHNNMYQLIDLREFATELPDNAPPPAPAFLLILRSFLSHDRANNVFAENMAYEWDKKFWNARQKKVQNKHARHNVCFGTTAQSANFDQGKGTVIAWSAVPATNDIANALPILLGNKGNNLVCEGNLYYDISKTGIGWHGDAERKKVIGCRFGESIPLNFRWWYNNMSFGNTFTILLNHGDAYIMSEKAVGWDWKNGIKYGPTLRHSAGSHKYTKVTK